jgi:hypothetical protein
MIVCRRNRTLELRPRLKPIAIGPGLNILAPLGHRLSHPNQAAALVARINRRGEQPQMNSAIERDPFDAGDGLNVGAL